MVFLKLVVKEVMFSPPFCTVEKALYISIDAPPYMNKRVSIRIVPNEPWVKTYVHTQKAPNVWIFPPPLSLAPLLTISLHIHHTAKKHKIYEWDDMVKRINLKVPVHIVTRIPGCEPATPVSLKFTGEYTGGPCLEQHVNCVLNLPPEFSATTNRPCWVLSSLFLFFCSCVVWVHLWAPSEQGPALLCFELAVKAGLRDLTLARFPCGFMFVVHVHCHFSCEITFVHAPLLPPSRVYCTKWWEALSSPFIK